MSEPPEETVPLNENDAGGTYAPHDMSEAAKRSRFHQTRAGEEPVPTDPPAQDVEGSAP
jgi:hypothetical protein